MDRDRDRFNLIQVAIEENNRNTLTQLSKFKKFQSQISEDFTKQFSVLEKLLDEFTTGAGKGKENTLHIQKK